MLTTCLIEALKEKIFGDTAGCYMATAVEFFGLKAKQAGWKGEYISSLRDSRFDNICRAVALTQFVSSYRHRTS